MNIVILSGNLTREPEVRHTTSGTAVCNGGIAVTRRFKNAEGVWDDEVAFVDFAIFGPRGEAFARYHHKGERAVLSSGFLRLDQWDDKATGQKRSRLKMIVDEWEFAGRGGAVTDATSDDSASIAEPSQETPF